MTEEMPDTEEVFSAHAEVVPPVPHVVHNGFSILRARGGSSSHGAHAQAFNLYSPRTRR